MKLEVVRHFKWCVSAPTYVQSQCWVWKWGLGSLCRKLTICPIAHTGLHHCVTHLLTSIPPLHGYNIPLHHNDHRLIIVNPHGHTHYCLSMRQHTPHTLQHACNHTLMQVHTRARLHTHTHAHVHILTYRICMHPFDRANIDD